MTRRQGEKPALTKGNVGVSAALRDWKPHPILHQGYELIANVEYASSIITRRGAFRSTDLHNLRGLSCALSILYYVKTQDSGVERARTDLVAGTLGEDKLASCVDAIVKTGAKKLIEKNRDFVAAWRAKDFYLDDAYAAGRVKKREEAQSQRAVRESNRWNLSAAFSYNYMTTGTTGDFDYR